MGYRVTVEGEGGVDMTADDRGLDAAAVSDKGGGEIDGGLRERLARVEQLIDQIGLRYVADLRVLSEELARFYAEQLAEKEAEVVLLCQRVEVSERENETLTARLAELQDIDAQYAANLRALSEEFSQRVEVVRGRRNNVAGYPSGGQP
jgi:ABC-type phosphate transport system auxiliary subunit